jgi:hypothetical protein
MRLAIRQPEDERESTYEGGGGQARPAHETLSGSGVSGDRQLRGEQVPSIWYHVIGDAGEPDGGGGICRQGRFRSTTMARSG